MSATCARSKGGSATGSGRVEARARSLPSLGLVGIGLPGRDSRPRSSTGPTPVPEALERCDELLDEATDRVRTGERARVHGRARGDRRPVRRRPRATSPRPRRPTRKSARSYARANNSGRILGRIEMLARRPSGRRGRLCEDCCEMFERMHDAAGLSTVAAELARALCTRRVDTTRRRAGSSSRRSAPPGRRQRSVRSWRAYRAQAARPRGSSRGGRGDSPARPSRIAERTDALSDHGDVLLDLAEVLRLAGSPCGGSRAHRAWP